MINYTSHYESIVRDEITTACRAIGADKGEAGYAISGGGAIELVVHEESGTAAPMPVWAVTVTLRSLLLGKPPVGARLQVLGVLPEDDDFRTVTRRLVAEIDKVRRQEFNGSLN